MSLYDDKVIISWLQDANSLLDLDNLSETQKKKLYSIVSMFITNPMNAKYITENQDILVQIRKLVPQAKQAPHKLYAQTSVMNIWVNDVDTMNTIASNPELRDWVRNDTEMWSLIVNNSMAVAKIVCGYAGLNPADYANIDTVVNSETAMNAVANSETAMNAIWNSSYRWTYFDSPYIDTVYDNSSTARSILRSILLNNSDIFGDNSIVAYYPFDGNANDYSGNGYHGTWSGIEQYDTGIIGQAAKFDGNSRITRDMEFGPNHTICFWMKNSDPLNDTAVIIGFFQKTDYTNSFLFGFDNHNSNTWINNTTYDTASFGNDFLFVCLCVGDSDTKLFYNGMLKNSISVVPSLQTYLFNIGSDVDSGPSFNDYWIGLIDSVRIFNRALTDTEVQRLYKLEYLARN